MLLKPFAKNNIYRFASSTSKKKGLKSCRRLELTDQVSPAMPSQEALSLAQQYAVFENAEAGGQLMTKNVPSNQAQRQVITNRGKKSPFKADVRLVTCVHGKMSQIDPTFASLVVLEYHLGCIGGSHRYDTVATRLAFKSNETKHLQDEPFVKAYAPFKQSKMMDAVPVEHSDKWKAEGNVGASFTPANAGLTIGKESEKKYNLDSCAFGQAFPEFTDGKAGTDAVIWEMRENKTKKVGVPDTFRVAFLIQRTNLEKFLGHFSLDLHAGIWFAATQSFKSVCGLIEVDDPIIFDPSLPSQPEDTDIVSYCLGEYVNQEKLESLAPVHLI